MTAFAKDLAERFFYELEEGHRIRTLVAVDDIFQIWNLELSEINDEAILNHRRPEFSSLFVL